MNVLNSLALLLSSSGNGGNPFDAVSQPVIQLIKSAAGPALGIVGALGTIYAVILGFKLAKAEEPQDQQKAKQALKNFIIGFVLIFVLIAVITLGMPAMVNWANSGNINAGITVSTN